MANPLCVQQAAALAMLCRGVVRRKQRPSLIRCAGAPRAGAIRFCAAAAAPTNKYAVKTFNAISAKVRRHRHRPQSDAFSLGEHAHLA